MDPEECMDTVNREVPGQFASRDHVFAVVSKPFKTEYDHEYGGGRLDKDPRKGHQEKWFVPDKTIVKTTQSYGRLMPSTGSKNWRMGSCYFQRKNGKITGKNNQYQNTNSRNNLSRHDFSNNNNMYATEEDCGENQFTGFTQQTGDTKRFMGGSDCYTIPYGVQREMQNIDHKTRLYSASSDFLKRENIVGVPDGGHKSIMIFNGRLDAKDNKEPQTPVKCYKEPFVSDYPTNIGYAGKATGLGFADVKLKRHHSGKTRPCTSSEQRQRDNNDDTVSRSSTMSETFWQNLTQRQNRPNNDGIYCKMSRMPKHDSNNIFKVNRPMTQVNTNQKGSSWGSGGLNNINFDSHWSKFCRGNLGPHSYLACANCDNVLCKQGDIFPHAYQWYRSMKNDRMFTGFGEDDCDGGLKGTFSRLKARVDTAPRECDCIFMKKPDWMRFYIINNGCNVACPKCKNRVGTMKLSGLKCGCGHTQIPGYQLLRKFVKVKA